ncbi:MAG: tRNA dihydrouridine synthase DusB [Myxococcota bacterium]|nr:tRNA dihydrouridine synthase DusB [Myxococcota bacterium]MDW8361391.1 tRNA dihydrouridine synthase DusB [Myxococcales bacterium]
MAALLPALRLGPLRIDPPVVLAPMAGVTNAPFRALCRRFGAGLFVCEMVAARPLAEGRAHAARLAGFYPDESPRSLQLYATSPRDAAEAIRRLVGEGRVDHVDLNFGCPVPKVTRKGGGAAIPARPRLLAAIVRAAVQAAGSIPVTIKFRIGLDDERITFLETGRIAEAEGCAAVTLHARTAAQLYDGSARWEAIAALKDVVRSIPVLGNGDVWEAADALRMVRMTGCDGIVVGRGCLGRPWLFAELAAAFEGRPLPPPPRLGEVCRIMIEHAERLCDWLGPREGIASFRKHAGWYTKGFTGSAAVRDRLMRITTLDELRAVLEALDPNEPFPPGAARLPRGKRAGTQKVALPPGFLDAPESCAEPEPHEMVDGG